MRRVDFGAGTLIGGAYAPALARMQAEADAIAQSSLPESYWIGAHDLTVTLGRSLKAKGQLLAPPGVVTVVEVERGGGATLHNPGQLVAYPLLRLREHGLSPISYLRLLERLLIDLLAQDGIHAQAFDGQTGVWVGDRKIASLGVSVVNGVTRHGLALNVCNALRDFSFINPCGFSAEVMVNVQHYRPHVSFAEYTERLAVLLEARIPTRGEESPRPSSASIILPPSRA